MLEYDCWSVVLSLQSNLPVHWKFFQDYQIAHTQYNLTYQQIPEYRHTAHFLTLTTNEQFIKGFTFLPSIDLSNTSTDTQ